MSKKSKITNVRSIEKGDISYQMIWGLIDREGGATVAQLREATGLGASTISRHTLRLTSEGKIHMVRGERDRPKRGGSFPVRYAPGPHQIVDVDENEDEETECIKGGGNPHVIRTTAVQTGKVWRSALDTYLFGPARAGVSA